MSILIRGLRKKQNLIKKWNVWSTCTVVVLGPYSFEIMFVLICVYFKFAMFAMHLFLGEKDQGEGGWGCVQYFKSTDLKYSWKYGSP